MYLPKQLEALHHLSRYSPARRVLYGGGVGGGKSEFGCRWQIERRLKYAGTRSVIGRCEFAALRTSTMHTFFSVIGKGLPHSPGYGLVNGRHFTYNGSTHVLQFSNGSEIIFKDLATYPSDPNFDTLGSLEITDYFIDEATEVSSRAADILHSRCRYRLDEYGLTPKGLLTCNPAKGWIYNDVYLPHKNGTLSDRWAFVLALASDNPFLPKSYIENLNHLTEHDRQRLLFGNWEYDDDADALFKTDDLARCFRNEIDEKAPTYITADIARFGKDRTVILVWRGLTVIDCKILHRADTQEVGQQIRDLIKRYEVKLSNVIADEDGIGGSVIDFLKCRGFMNGSKAPHPDRFVNLKAECYYQLAVEVERGNIVFMAGERNQIIKELEMIKRHRSNTDQKLSVTPKDQIKNTYGISPDIADAIMMRMYWVVSATRGVYAVN